MVNQYSKWYIDTLINVHYYFSYIHFIPALMFSKSR